MPLAGGPADKAGNSYERRWTVFALIDLLEGRAQSLRIEVPGDEGVGAEFRLAVDARAEWHQAKRQRAAGPWTISALTEEGVLQPWWEKIARGGRCVFVSSSGAPELLELVERAESAASWDEFDGPFLATGKQRGLFQRLRGAWTNAPEDEVYAALREVRVHAIGERDLELWIKDRLRAIIEGNPATAAAILGQLADDSCHKLLTVTDVWEQLTEHGITPRNLSQGVAPGRLATETAASYLGYRRPFLDPPYQALRSGVPEVWLLQPRFGVVPYLGRAGLLGDLQAWCAETSPFSIGSVSGEGGSGKSRLAAELCDRMQACGWEAGLVSTAEALTEFVPEAPALLVVDYPEQLSAVLGAAMERLASRVAGPRVRVLLLARQPAAQSHWWAELDRTSRRTASLFAVPHRDLSEYTLSLPERLEHAEAAVQAFGLHLGADVSAVPVPDVTDNEFANPLLVHVAALLAVHGHRSALDTSRSVREDVLAHLLVREQNRWDRLRATHQLGDLHETHALRAVLVAVLTGPSAGEVTDLLAALPEFSEPAQRERRGRIGYWLAELYPGEPLLASFGPDLLVLQPQ